MESTIFRFIFRYSRTQQLFLLLLTAISLPFLYASLDLPKTIINEAIGGKKFPKTLLGMELGQVEYLMLLCAIFLVLVLINGGFKYWINVFKGQLGERMLRRLRYMLYSHILRFPLPHFRKVSQGELIAMITAEVEPLGGFIGDALAQPAFQGGTLLTILVFMFMQDPVLGAAAIAFYPAQMYVIPKLQARVNQLAKERVRTVRKLSERVGETVSGVQEIHAHGTSEFELADFSWRAGTIYDIRYRIYRQKFFIKFLNNFIAMVTPFFFFSIGGYLVIQGNLTFGALVAVLAAYKDLSSPWKELLDYYQQRADARIKYEQIIEQFQTPGLLDERLQREAPESIPPLHGTMYATNLVFEEDGGAKVVDGVNFQVDTSAKTAILGPSGLGRSALAKLIARLLMPSGGSLKIDKLNLSSLPESVTGRRIAYADGSPYVFSGSIRHNLLYGLKHRPAKAKSDAIEPDPAYDRFVSEAMSSGNTTSDIRADWIDYEAFGNAAVNLDARALEVLRVVQLEEDVFALGLSSAIDPERHPKLVEQILEGRKVLHRRLAELKFRNLVERFDKGSYNFNMSVAENLLFGNPIGGEFQPDRLGQHPYVLAVLAKVGLTEEFLSTGFKLASVLVELFQGLSSGHEVFERYSFVSADDLAEYQHVVRRVEASGLDQLDKADRDMLMSLPLKLIPARHRLGSMDERMQANILEARKVFAADLPPELQSAIQFFDPDKYNTAASIQDNILFGKPVYGRAHAFKEVNLLVRDVIHSLGLREAIVVLGLEAAVGIAGGRLTLVQRQKLGLARSLMKRPDYLIVDGAIAALDPTSQRSIMTATFQEMDGRGIIWILDSMDAVDQFDAAIVMEEGRIIEQGRRGELKWTGSGAAVAASGD